MRTTDLFKFNRSSKRLNESLEKTFGNKINFEEFDTPKLEDARNKLRTQIHTARGQSGFNEDLENDALSKAQFMHDAIVAELAEREEYIVDNSSVEEAVDFDKDEVVKILSRFESDLNEIGGYADLNYNKIMDTLAKEGAEAAVEEVSYSIGDQDGGEVRGVESYLEGLQDELDYVLNGPDDEGGREEGIEMERVRDPEEWDEGDTEPANNFAVYINGKKWKVFKGRGQYADDAREQAHYQQLKDWARKKSESTGKKWEVSITGENPTESVEEAEQSVSEGSAHGYNVVRWYRKNRNSSKITAWLKKEAGLPKETKLYFDDADLVLGSDTVVPEALVDDTLKFNDLLTALMKVTGGAPKQKTDGVYRSQDNNESAPPTAKGERMVKHIKKGYADDGKLTDKEKGIAYATAWKAHNKNESIEQTGDDMRNLREGEIQQASAIVTAKTMVDRVGRWIEELSGMENDTLLQLGDSIRDEMGQEQAKAFIEAVAPAIQQALDTLKGTRDTLSTGVRSLASGEQPTDMLGAEPGAEMAEPAAPDAMNMAEPGAEMGGDEFAAAEPAAGGMETAGREQRESINRQTRLMNILAG